MRMDKLTLKAQEAVSNAQNIATENNHHEILPEHLLKSLAGQDGGIFSSIAQKIGASVLDIKNEVDNAISTFPKQIGGGPGGGVMSAMLGEVLNKAWDEAVNLKDEYLSTEHLILSLSSMEIQKLRQSSMLMGLSEKIFLKFSWIFAAARGSPMKPLKRNTMPLKDMPET